LDHVEALFFKEVSSPRHDDNNEEDYEEEKESSSLLQVPVVEENERQLEQLELAVRSYELPAQLVGPFAIPTVDPAALAALKTPSPSSLSPLSSLSSVENWENWEKATGAERKRRRRRREEDEEEAGRKSELKSRVARRRQRTDKGTFVKQRPFLTQEEIDAMDSSDEN